jgi:hypothetical protein
LPVQCFYGATWPAAECRTGTITNPGGNRRRIDEVDAAQCLKRRDQPHGFQLGTTAPDIARHPPKRSPLPQCKIAERLKVGRRHTPADVTDRICRESPFEMTVRHFFA